MSGTQQAPAAPGAGTLTLKQPEGTKPVTGTDTVTVALKHPNGIVLQAYKMVESGEVSQLGYRTMKIAEAIGEPFTLKGTSIDIASLASGHMPEHQIVGGYALNTGVPKDLWENWYAANKDGKMVKERLIYALPSEQHARDFAKEHSATVSNLEPLDPKDPSRRTGMRGIETGTTGNIQEE